MFTSLSPEKRKYRCPICDAERIVETRQIEKWVAVCLHVDTRGTTLPVLQLREEGEVVKN